LASKQTRWKTPTAAPERASLLSSSILELLYCETRRKVDNRHKKWPGDFIKDDLKILRKWFLVREKVIRKNLPRLAPKEAKGLR
jgi:hypothetical protein